MSTLFVYLAILLGILAFTTKLLSSRYFRRTGKRNRLLQAAWIATGLGCVAAIAGSIPVAKAERARIASERLARHVADQDAVAARTVKTLLTSQVTYSTTYPQAGYAASLASLGPEDDDCKGEPSAKHACLLKITLGCPAGIEGKFCSLDGFRYSITGVWEKGLVMDFVIF